MVEVAAEVFGSRGYHATSMDEIASRAGISKPMLYSYFGSKEGLFLACGMVAGERMRDRVREAARARDVPPDERLWRGLLAVFGFIEEHREMWSIFNPPGGIPPSGTLGEQASEGREAMGELLVEVLVEAAVAEGVAPEAAVETAPLAHALTATVVAMADWWLRHPDEPRELQALRVMNFAWIGFEQLLQGRMWLPSD